MVAEPEENTTGRAGTRRAGRGKDPQAPDVRALVLTGLVILTSVPLAVLVVPNTISLAAGAVVRSLEVDVASGPKIVRSYGLALPALMLTVPFAAVYARRGRPWPVLLAGLALLGLTEVVAGAVGSVFWVAFLRIFQGIGAGLVLPGTLALVATHPLRGQRLLSAWYAGVLVASLMAATPLIYLTLLGDDWHAIMQPYPWLVGLALLFTAGLVVTERREGVVRATARASERILLLPAIPALALSVFAVGASFNWSTWALLALAVTALIVMYGLTTLGDAFDGRLGTNHVVVAVTAGVVVLPVTAQVVNLSLPVFGGPGLGAIWLPLLVAVVVTMGTAIGGVVFGPPSASPQMTIAGLVAAGLGLAAIRLLVPATDWLVLLALTLLGGGLGLAFGATLRRVGTGAALLGLGVIFPAVLAGQLLSGAIMLRFTEQIASGSLHSRVVHDLLLSALGSWVTVSALVTLVAIADVTLAWLRSRRAGSTSITEGDDARDEAGDGDGEAAGEAGTGAEAPPDQPAERAGHRG